MATTSLKRTDSQNRVKPQKRAVKAHQIALILLCLDIIGLFVSTIAAYALRLGEPWQIADSIFFGFIFIVLAGLYLGDAYKPATQMTYVRTIMRVIVSVIGTAALISILIYALGLWGNVKLAGRGIWLPSLAMFSLWAILFRILASHWVQQNLEYRSWLVISHERILQFIEDFQKLDPLGQFSVLSDQHCSAVIDLNHHHLHHINSIQNLEKYSSQHWSGVIITDPAHLTEIEKKELLKLRFQGIPILTQDKFYEDFAFKIPPSSLNDEWFAFGSGFNLLQGRLLSKKFKRLIDIVAALALLIILWPIMLIVAVAIKMDSPGSILYSQMRTGLHGRSFRVYKFRSMVRDSENGHARWAQKQDARITDVGHWIRLLRIDELPQLWNVLTGDMSLIGPRPERPEFDQDLEQQIPYYNIRYLVKPGITGWAQVMYPYGASVEDAYEKLAYDLYYIKHFSLDLDFAIALKTVRIVFLGKGR